VNTHLRPLHIPKSYFDSFIKIFAVPDLTCNKKTVRTKGYGEVIDSFLCTCYGNNFNGMPEIEI
jgi:hypothetical protein